MFFSHIKGQTTVEILKLMTNWKNVFWIHSVQNVIDEEF